MTARHLLVIDDEPFVGQIVRRTFERGPFTVSTAPDGAAGLQFLREHPEIACVFVDINMPGMSGLDVIEQSRSDSKLAHTMFVVLTAAGDQEYVARARRLGAAAFVTKPFSPNKLYQQIMELLGEPADPHHSPES